LNLLHRASARVSEFKDCRVTDAVIPAERPTHRESVKISVPHRRALAPPEWPGIGYDARQAL